MPVSLGSSSKQRSDAGSGNQSWPAEIAPVMFGLSGA
eukprot:CAMPEP_0206498528 /NCGR_PEP_ID=MMETSP0324_2-20121206/51069_1 /ASSEMBLY_ACC=CAM_ASM_000836 /TAXON_ID=2866 /ORGANISM="Crypthecodinium cohnii, Strain Seligo" /LENGTH=36 /DNA_ID= /DNA_START= /DNA_END= /DNA_ORIENTATION=